MPQGIKNVYHFFVAVLATVFFRYPAKNLTVIGVTGTDGKTTTVNLIYEILRKAGKPAAMISSVGAKIGDRDYDLPFHVTTPSPWQLQRFIKLAVDKQSFSSNRGEKYLVLEVTSHALDQNRVWGIPFKIGVLTNITHEHLDYHKTYDNYLKAKAKLFKGVEWAILNKEDKSYSFVISRLKAEKSLNLFEGTGIRQRFLAALGMTRRSMTKILTYGLRDGNITPSKFSFRTPLAGEYNQSNCLAAIAACRALGISDKKIRQTVAEFGGVLGRFEFVETGRDFRVVIDFAHTPNALEQVLSTVRQQVAGRLIHVFGSAGLRDVSKRPMMGEISAKYADVVILTEEDHRTEDVNQIIEEIGSGIIKHGTHNIEHLYKVPNRQEAINRAISMAEKGDLVLLTGKGHEKSLCRGEKEYPWSEHEAVKKALEDYRHAELVSASRS